MREKGEEIKGRVKEAGGVLTENKKLERSGRAEQSAAKVKKKASKAAEKMKKAVHKVVDRVRKKAARK